MICLPGKDPNQYDLFDPNINFAAEASTIYPPNMQDIMDELAKPDAFSPSPNIALIEELESLLTATPIYSNPSNTAAQNTAGQQLFDGNYNFANDSQFAAFTTPYGVGIPPLLPNSGGIQSIINTLRTHIYGIPTTIPGVIGSLGHANTMRTLGYANQGNNLQRSLGLGAIPDCGLIDKLLGLLRDALQPLIDLLADLLAPLVELIAWLLGILAAILAELLKLLNLAQQLINFANAAHSLSFDPCSLLYMAEKGSPDLKEVINDGILWKGPNLPRIPDIGVNIPPPPPPPPPTVPPPPPPPPTT